MFSPLYYLSTRQCWNRQTGTFEGRVRERMGSSPICRTIKQKVANKATFSFCPYLLGNLMFSSLSNHAKQVHHDAFFRIPRIEWIRNGQKTRPFRLAHLIPQMILWLPHQITVRRKATALLITHPRIITALKTNGFLIQARRQRIVPLPPVHILPRLVPLLGVKKSRDCAESAAGSGLLMKGLRTYLLSHRSVLYANAI